MRVLAITKVFPNAVVPLDEPHIRQQYAALGQTKDCDVEVLATIPWFPGLSALRNASYAGRIAGAPRHETIEGLFVHHPRFLQIPKIGVPIAATLYALSILPIVARRRRHVDIILATWAYPDGAAAVALGKILGIPVVVEVIGSDMNVVAQMPSARLNLELTLPHAAGVVAVSEQLGHAVAALGVNRDRISIIPTGINRSLFHPRDRHQGRRDLAIPEAGKIILFLGRLDRAKGIFDLADAFARLASRHPDWSLIFVGADETRGALARAVEGLADRVQLVGQRPVEEIPTWLAACDVLALPSYAEGTPNVILEAFACGRRVVASDVGGIPDVLTSPRHGALVRPRDVEGLERALEQILAQDEDPIALAHDASILSWGESAERLRCALAEAVTRG